MSVLTFCQKLGSYFLNPIQDVPIGQASSSVCLGPDKLIKHNKLVKYKLTNVNLKNQVGKFE